MDTDLVERRLLGVLEGPDPAECWDAAAKGVDVFLAAYGAADHGPPEYPR
jgi:hypothetical protein